MKTICTLLIAASALAFVNVAQAQSNTAIINITPSAPVALYSNDPFIQKRHADSVAKAEYEARNKAAEKEMKAEKKEAKSELKADLSAATDTRNATLAAETAVTVTK